MKLQLTVSTKWVGAKESIIVDTEELGFSDQQWDELSEVQQDEFLQEYAMELIGFGWSHKEV